jgi:hypothetical protein
MGWWILMEKQNNIYKKKKQKQIESTILYIFYRSPSLNKEKRFFFQRKE